MSKFDPAKKIALIKEVRAMLNLGLKEAKDMVEGAPVWIKKEVKKEDADKLVEKLVANGAECRMVWLHYTLFNKLNLLNDYWHWFNHLTN